MKDWNGYFQQPKTIVEAVNQLMTVLDSEKKLAIATMPEEGLINLHFSIGIMVRNAFGLHNPDSQLLASCGTAHPDDASDEIIHALWQQLRAS